MKAKFLLGVAVASFVLGGCVVHSIQPLFAEKDFVAFSAVVGTWTQKEGEEENGKWTFVAEEKRYRLTHLDKKGRLATFNVVSGKIGTHVFLDFMPENASPEEKLNEFMEASILPAHIWVKVAKKGSTLSFVAMDYEWLDKHLQQNPKAIAHVIQDKRPILTASTEELQKFVAKHADDTNVFKNEIILAPKGAR